MSKLFFVLIIIFIIYYLTINYFVFGFEGRGYNTQQYANKECQEDSKDGKLTLRIKHYFPLVNLYGTKIIIKDNTGTIYYCGEYKKKIKILKYPNGYLSIRILKDNLTYIYGSTGYNFISDTKDPFERQDEFKRIRENEKEMITLKVILLPWFKNFCRYSMERVE